jgi:hypothetical protein
MNHIRRAALIMALTFCLFSSQVIADIEDNIVETFNVDTGGTLVIESDLGSINITTHNKKTVDVNIIRKLDTNSKKEADRILEDLTIDFEQQGDDITIIAKLDKEDWGFWKKIRRKIKVEFNVLVPEEYNAILKTSGGSISVDDLDGSVTSKTSGGSLKFGHINGPVSGHTSGGSITLAGCTGDADIKTSGGSLNIGNVDGNVVAKTSGGSIRIASSKGPIDAVTSGGSVNVEEVAGKINAKTSGGSVNAKISDQPGGPCRLSTSGGSINVYLAEDINVTVDAKTSGGKVRTEFPVTVQGEIKKNRLNADINGGGPDLILRTSGGNINIKEL